MSNFIKQVSFDVDYAPSNITKYVSKKTGLQITLINQQSPSINGYFTVATEIANDSGCPHTLEHIVFMGSKKYPYKGLLDTLGNRAFSSTNAWTGVDQTVYTLTSAGWEGFRTLLPVYLDHLVNPTITDEACLTEVFHIDGKGKEKGVVFSEMQGIETQSWFINYLEMQRTLFKEGSGYRSETGGLLGDLRKLNWDEIRDFHKSMYRPDNLCVIITGSIDEDDLLKIMQEFDESLPLLPSTPNKRPFVDSAPIEALTSTIVKRVEFPDKDESMGEMLISWVGPSAEETLENIAVDILGTYFTDSVISLFNKNLVEIENPMATDIGYTTDDFTKEILNFNVSGIPVEKLEEVDSTIKRLLKEHIQAENLDLSMVRQVLNQEKLKYMFNSEKSPSSFSRIAISEYIYGNSDGSDLVKWAKDLNEYETLAKWEAKEWCDLIDKWFISNHSATMLGVPSAKLYEANKKSNKAISEGIQQKYGESGLAELAKQLDEAQTKNDKKIPDSLLTSFPKPDPSNIPFIKTKSYKAGTNDFKNASYVEDDTLALTLKDDSPKDLPLYFHVEDFKSQFLTIHLLASSYNVPDRLKPYLNILDVIFSSSVKLPSGETVPYEQVISDLKTDLIDHDLDNSFEGQYLEFVDMKFKIETQNYSKAIDWFSKIINHTVFGESRVKSAIEKIVNSIPETKRDGNGMMYSLMNRTLFNSKSLKYSKDILATEDFLKSALAKIEGGDFEVVSKDLYELRELLFSTNNLRILLIGDVSKIPNPISTWTKFADSYEKKSPSILSAVPRTFEALSEKGKNVKEEAFLITAPTSSSTFLLSCTAIPTDYSHPDANKIALAKEILTAIEGPFWRGIRGAGLAYGASISRSIENGLLSFSIYRGADAIEAFKTAKQIVDEYTEGDKIDQLVIEGAISAMVNQIVEVESNFIDASNSQFLDNVLKERGPDFNAKFLKDLTSITIDEIKNIFKKYFQPLFDSKNSMVFACLHPNSAESTKEFLESCGYQVSVEELVGAADVGSDDEHDHDDCSSCEEGEDYTTEEESGEESDEE